jgi:hypothetical protein
MASIKQCFITRERFSSDIIQPIHVGPAVFLLFQYADNIALTHQARKFEECEIHLEERLETLIRFFHQRHLRPKPSKTEVCVFHLGTHDANRKLTVQFDNTLITHVDHPKYLEMTLDRTLFDKPLLEKKTGIKVNSRVKIVRQ